MNEPILEAKKLCKTFGSLVAVQDVSIDINKDEILFHCGDEPMNLNFIDLDLCRLKPNFEELMRVNK